MKINREYVGIAGIAAKDDSRQVLAYLNVIKDERSPTGAVIVASNGFMLACVPCTLEETENPGLLDVGTFTKIVKAAPRRMSEVIFALDREMATYDRVNYPRHRAPDDKDLTFPDFMRIIPRDVKTGLKQTRAYPISFNPEYMGLLGKALGGVGLVCWPNPVTRSGPMLVTPVGVYTSGGALTACDDILPKIPYGVLMPMADARGDTNGFDDVKIKSGEEVQEVPV